jgi:hypothetical protein
VNDAIAPFGVAVTEHPLTPMRVRDLLRGRAAAPASQPAPPATRPAIIESMR